jgi:filamentous hemagglutinin family protein
MTMNHTFQLIWNPATQSHCPAPETARNKRKGGGRRLALALAVAAATSGAYAGPSGGVVVDGDANIDIRGKLTDILQNSQNTTIVWDNFDINADEIVNFIQPNESSIALNRVFSADGTQINGQLNANGRVFVLDANGVLFGQESSVNVGSLVASTLDVSHNDYTHFTFSGNGAPASVTNLGNISVADTGAVALLGGQVSNRGVIQAKLGNVALAAGNKITLDFAGDNLLNVQVDEAALNALAENHGLIQASGGQVLMTAHASDALLQTVVNNTGVIEAQSLQEQDGKILLLGGMTENTGGTVRVSGTLDASAPEGGNGGFIETSGAVVKATSQAQINTSAANGEVGTWLLDPTDLEISYDPMGGNNGTSHVHTQALQNSLVSGNVTLQTANTGGGNGDITIADPIIWGGSNTLTLDAHGGITFSDYLHAPDGGLTLTAGGNIGSGAEGHIRVGSFTLEGGDFSQINANLPVFNADVFTLNGGTFTRATGGNGTGSPLVLVDAYGLQGLATTPSFNATLGADIDLSGIDNFQRIGDDTSAYTGAFDGAGHFIDNLTITVDGQYETGLFGVVGDGGSVANVGLYHASVTATNSGDVGILVGRNEGTVTNSFTEGSVTANDSVGGLVGWNSGNGVIETSYSTASVTAQNASGGRAGGLLGYNGGNATVTDSWASGFVSGGSILGGLVGFNRSGASVTNSYADADTTGQAALIGQNNGAASNSAPVSGVSGGNPSAYQQASYANLDFTSDWFIAEGFSRPMLRAFLDGGNISNLYQLQGMAADLGGTYTLTQDIDASATASTDNADVWGGRGFAPVGSLNSVFTGNLEGAGFEINGLTINRPNQALVGLFGSVDNTANVQNLGLTDVSITGNNYTGGLVARNKGSISNSYVTGSVEGVQNVGGLVGESLAGSISNSYATVAVAGAVRVGGLVGDSSGGTSLSSSYATGAVTASVDHVGGLVGSSGGGTSISNSYATGAVSGGGDYVGGLVGSSNGISNSVSISNSYATGAVSGSGTFVGGLVGINYAGSSISTSYWDIFTTGQNDAIGQNLNAQTVTPVNGDWTGIPTAYNANSYAGFDFTSAGEWFIAEGSSRPMLRSFLSGGSEIHNLYDLQGMAADLGGNYTLMADIDASATASSNNADVWGGRGFAPVGNGSNAFTGRLTGNGFKIDNITINRPDQDYVGLIGNAGAGSELSNLKLFANVVGADQTGLLAGANAGTIGDALIGGEVTGANAVGGVVGLNSGAVNTSMFVGFLSGQIQGDTKVGGLVGENTGSINNSMSVGTVVGLNAATQIGGLVGFNDGGTIAQSYTLGDATGNGQVGALVGDNAGTLTDLFWFDIATANGVGAGTASGATALTQAEMTDLASFASWGTDIDAEGGTGSVWRIYDGQMIPLLRSQLTEVEVTAYDDRKVYDGAAYDGLHDINSTTGAGVRYGNNYAEFVEAFGQDGVPYDGSDSLESQNLEYMGDSQGAVNVGTYDITPSELMSGIEGFDIVYNDGVLTIEQAVVNVTVTVDDASKEYGDADPTFSWGITSGSLGSGDTLTGNLTREPGEDVGNYAITGALTGDLASNNYDVTLVDGVFTITPRAITVDIADLAKVYGDDDPSFSWAISNGSLADGDELSGTLTRVAGEDVGGYAITGMLEGDLASDNYTVTVDDGLLTITPRPLVISADDLAKVYGQADPEFTWSQGGTVVNGDTLSVSLSRTEGQDVGYYTITPEVTGDVVSDNYTLSINNGALQVTPAALTVTADDLETYWGLLPDEFSATLEGLTNGDTEQDVFGNSLEVTSDLTLPIPGDYTLTPMGMLASNNYEVTFTDGTLSLLSSNPGNGYGDGLTSTQLPAREALGSQNRANIYEGRDLLDGKLDEIALGVYQDGVRVPAEQLAELGIIMPRAVLFGINSDHIDEPYVDMLRAFVTKLENYPELNLLVEGHTSNTGPRSLNERLSRQRAMAVYNLLVELGVDPARLGKKGFSWDRPIADNSTLEGRALNRRAEVTPDKPSADQDDAPAAEQ